MKKTSSGAEIKEKKLNESATYSKISVDEQDFDSVPDNIYATKSGYHVPQTQGLTMEEVGDESEEDLPEEEPPIPPPEKDLDSEIEEEKTVNELQNEIIKYNIETLKAIYQKINDLNNSVVALNNKQEELNRDVEEVREPTNVEKLVRQKEVSYPYYFNLNDFWKNNWFEKQNMGSAFSDNQEQTQTVGSIKQLPDGTYVADFDDLPKNSFIDIEKSFHDIK